MKPREGYSRALIKLSGDAFAPQGAGGFDEAQAAYITDELLKGHEICSELAVVVGGGNIIRGARFRPSGPARLRADYAGMVATIINALLLEDHLLQAGVACRLYSALPLADVAAPFAAESAREELRRGVVVILAGGTGNPLFTTDTAAALRAVQLDAQILLKATRVDGVYSADPEHQADAELFSRLTYEEVLNRKLKVMDLGAVSLCMEHSLPVRVFNYKVAGNIRRALQGEPVGTLIGCRKDDD